MNQPGQGQDATESRFYAVLRFIAKHVGTFYGAVLTYLSFSFFVALGALWAFAALADEVLEGSTQAFDDAVLQWVVTHRSPTLDSVALEVTALGNTAVLAVLVLAVSVFLWLTHHRFSVYLLLIALAGGAALNWILKAAFARPRPGVIEWGTVVRSESFPSGHSMSAMIVYGCVAYLCGRLEPTLPLRWSTYLLAALLILGIGASRIYLGVHYPSDVVGGYAAGLTWTAVVVSGLTAIRYFSGRKPEVIAEEQDLHAEEERKRGLRE